MFVTLQLTKEKYLLKEIKIEQRRKKLWLNWQFFLHQFKSRNQILSSFFVENILDDVIKLLKKQKLLLSNRVWDIWFMMAPWFSLIIWSKKNSWITKICYNLQWLHEHKSIWNQMWKAFNDPQYYPIKIRQDKEKKMF